MAKYLSFTLFKDLGNENSYSKHENLNKNDIFIYNY